MTLCEENCQLIDYNYINKKVKCSCDIKMNLPNIEEIKFDKELLKKSFIDINNMINLNVMKCYKKVFIKNNLKYNIGFFILFGVIVFFVISCFIFICKSFSQLCIDIKEIILAKRNIQFNNNLKTNNNIITKIKKEKYKPNKKIKKARKKNIFFNKN